jgi:hypothetical protein
MCELNELTPEENDTLNRYESIVLQRCPTPEEIPPIIALIKLGGSKLRAEMLSREDERIAGIEARFDFASSSQRLYSLAGNEYDDDPTFHLLEPEAFDDHHERCELAWIEAEAAE